MSFSYKYLKISLYLIVLTLSTNSSAAELSVMSWNVYFDDISGQTRYPKIINAIDKHQADIICLQEVTDSFIKNIQISSLNTQYKLIMTSEKKNYRNIILTKLKSINSGSIQIPTNMNRSVPYITFSKNNTLIKLANVHLDSMLNDTELRINQINKILSHINSDESLILCGDVNYGDDNKENILTEKHFKDSAGNDKRASYNTIKNKLAGKTKFISENSRRLDRILITGELSSTDYKLYEYPFSDHYPISSTILIK